MTKTLTSLLGLFILLLALLLPVSALTSSSEDWLVSLNIVTEPDGWTTPYGVGFGAKDGASDAYSEDEGDEIPPPTPPDPWQGIVAYFYYPANPEWQRNLCVSITGPATSIIWPLRVKTVNTGDTNVTISWPDISSVPDKYVVLELQTTANETLADMRSVDHYTFAATEGTTYNFLIKAEVAEIPRYNLTISSSAGGNVTTPGEGVFTYDEGTVVPLVAQADAGYRFAEWTGDVGTIADIYSSSTSITMYGNYSITANFEQAPAVGGSAYPVGKLAILTPWIALGAAFIIGTSLLILRRRRA